MKGALLIGTCFVVLVACDVPQPTTPQHTMHIALPVTHFTLPNGLDVVVQEDHRTPRVAVNIRYHAGAKDDPPGRAGMAHLVEHLQFTESQHTAPDSFHRTMAQLGAEDVNGTTDRDGTNYFETVPSSSLEPALWIEADRMASARLGWSDRSITREKNIVGQELRLRYRNEPNGFFQQILTHAVFPERHPYRRALDEEAQERASTQAELIDFASRAYGPDNATLLLVGDVTADRAKELVGKYFGGVAPCTAHFAPVMVAPVERAALKRIDIAADVPDPIVYVAWPLPSPTDDGFFELRYALGNVKGFVLAHAETEHKTMRPGSIAWNLIEGRLGSVGYIAGVPTAGSKAEDLVESIEEARSWIVARELGKLGAQRTNAIANEIRDVEGLGARAKRMQYYLENYGEADYVMKSLAAIQSVSKSQMVAAVDKFLDLDRAVVIVVKPDHEAPRAGRIVSEVPR